MLVGDLISILSKHDKNMAVLVNGYEYGLCDLEASNIQVVRFGRDVNSYYYAGPHEEDSRGDETGVVLGRG